MPYKCVIKNCDRQNKHLQNRSLFHFPKDLETKTKWISIIPRAAYNIIKQDTRICSLHFEKKFLKALNTKRYDRYRLDLNAFPSLNFDLNDPKCSFDNVSLSNSKNDEESIRSDEPEIIENLTIKNEMICRACLCDDVELLNSFLDDMPMLDMYNGCIFLQVEIGDGLPMNLCTTCVSKCIDWLSFKQLCEQNESKLRSQLTTNQIVYTEMTETTRNSAIDEQKLIPIDFPLGVQISIVTPNDNNLNSEITQLKDDLIYEEIDVKTEIIDIEDSMLNVNTIPELLSSSPAEVTTVITTNNKKIPNKPYKCDKCPRSFGTYKSLSCHKTSHRNNGPFKCDICGKEFGIKPNLRNHMINLHGPRRFACTKCPKRFATQTCLRGHMETHVEEKLFECEKCHKWFSTKKNLISHMRIHSDQPKFLCSFCGKGFVKCSNYKDHLILHSGKRDFHCPFCDKSFPVKGSLTLHLACHSDERPHICTICNKTFKTSHSLSAHRKKHLDTYVKPMPKPKMYLIDGKRFHCIICKQSFSTQKELNLDLRTHVDHRVYRCSFCDQVFKYNTDLKVHVRRHTGERPFPCTICTDTFRSNKILKFHMNKQHANKND